MWKALFIQSHEDAAFRQNVAVLTRSSHISPLKHRKWRKTAKLILANESPPSRQAEGLTVEPENQEVQLDFLNLLLSDLLQILLVLVLHSYTHTHKHLHM